MKKERAESYYRPVILCPLCNHLEDAEEGLDRMVDHLVEMHTDKEAINKLGWEE